MAKKMIIISILLVLTIVITQLLYFEGILGKTPLKNLNSSDISSMSVLGNPPNRTVLIHKNEQIKEVVDILNTVPTYKRDDSWKDSIGQFVQFTLTSKDGSTLKVGVFNPFIIINGKAYKSKYEPCEELNSLGNKLLN